MKTKADIARYFGVNPTFVTMLVRGDRHTTMEDLAIAVSKLSGKKPIDHITKRNRKAYLIAYPELNRKTRKAS